MERLAWGLFACSGMVPMHSMSMCISLAVCLHTFAGCLCCRPGAHGMAGTASELQERLSSSMYVSKVTILP